MKTPNGIKLALSIFTAIALLSWIGPYDNLTHTPNMAISGNSATATRNYSVNAPQLNANGNLTDPSQRYKVFFFTGDGSYVLDEMLADNAYPNPTWTYSHTYSNGGVSYKPYVETTDIYDDNTNPPGRAAIPPFTTGIGSTTSPNYANLGLSTVKIIPVRKMVTDHALTYIVTYENPATSPCEQISGNVKFTFDASKMHYEGFENYPSAAAIDATNATAGTMLIPFTNLAKGEQKNAFLNFKTTGLYQQTVAPPTAQLQITSGSSGCDFSSINTRAFVLSEHSVIDNAHDPNHKSVWLEERAGKQYLVYMIEFQNDGPGVVENVTITDELDVKLKGCALNDANLILKPARGQKILPTFLSNGIINVDWRGINLPGLGQPDYGVAFGEPETKGALKIEIPISPGCPNALLPCDAFLNRASIRFDCNPPIETNLTIFNLNCTSSWAVLDTTPTPISICADTLLSSDSIQLLSPPPINGTPLLDATDPVLAKFFDPSNGFHCQWYPESGLKDPATAGAAVKEYKNKTYTMVASKNCQRYILHRTVVVPCSIALSATVQPAGANYNVTLTVTNPSGNPLQWQDCIPVTTNPLTINLAPGRYYFSVYDEQTGCYAEQWVTLCGNEPTVTDVPNDCTADLQVSGGNPPYFFHWEWNGQQQTFSGQTLNLNWKNGVQVTVTDSNGCSTVFQPVPGNCAWWNNGWFVTIAVLLLGIIGSVIFFVFNKKK